MTDYFIIAYFNILFTHLQVITVKSEGLFNPSLVTTVAAQCLPCGKQKVCTLPASAAYFDPIIIIISGRKTH